MEMRTIFLTGATGLIGKMLTKKFLERGDRVVFTSRSPEKVEALCALFDRKNIFGCPINLIEDDALEKVKTFLASNNLEPQYLVNNARSLDVLKTSDFRRIDKEQWFGEYMLDVVVPYNLTILLSEIAELRAVVNVSSMYGMLAYNDYLREGSKAISIQYGTAKAALIHLTRELAVRLAPIRVNAISYGGVVGRTDAAFQKRYAQLCPSRRMLSEEDVVGHVMYLCSEEASGMTGHNLVVDGGFSAW